MAASIREWGWTNPVLIDEDGTIIAGHCRVLDVAIKRWQAFTGQKAMLEDKLSFDDVAAEREEKAA